MNQSHASVDKAEQSLANKELPIRRVVKIGGSCLENPRLTTLLNLWFASQPRAENWVIVGGGECIEAMRALSQRYSLRQEDMHWRCIHLLDATWEIMAELFSHWIPIKTQSNFQQKLQADIRDATYLVRVQSFYNRPDEIQFPKNTHSPSTLPVGWETTTDSLAALLASIVNANELVLVKSCEIPSNDPNVLRHLGIVDDAFPRVLPKRIQLKLVRLGN